MEAAEIREMLLELALAKAHRLVSVVDEHELNLSGIEDQLEVDGVEWHVHVAYDRLSGNIGIQARPLRAPQSLFELLGWQSPDEQFGYSLPVSWLPALDRYSS